MEMEQFYYDNKIVKNFIYATLFWGVVGMGVGLLLAYYFLFPTLTEGISWLSFGRLRPLHTNAVIFAFVFLQEVTTPCSVCSRHVCTVIS